MTESIHDFTAKLRQPSLREHLTTYVRWRKDLARARAQGAGDPAPPDQAPISINLDLTTACNYRCDHCIDWDILNSRFKHEEQELRESMRVMAERGMRSVILIGGGEPTVHPRFVDFVAYLKELELQVAVKARVRAGRAEITPSSALSEGFSPLSARSRRFSSSQAWVWASASLTVSSPNTCG